MLFYIKEKLKNLEPIWIKADLTAVQAIMLAESHWWENKSDLEIATVQLFTKRLIVPFDSFHEAMENILEMSIFSHAFDARILQPEFIKKYSLPTIDQINQIIVK